MQGGPRFLIGPRHFLLCNLIVGRGGGLNPHGVLTQPPPKSNQVTAEPMNGPEKPMQEEQRNKVCNHEPGGQQCITAMGDPPGQREIILQVQGLAHCPDTPKNVAKKTLGLVQDAESQRAPLGALCFWHRHSVGHRMNTSICSWAWSTGGEAGMLHPALPGPTLHPFSRRNRAGLQSHPGSELDSTLAASSLGPAWPDSGCGKRSLQGVKG